jgi:hypothetical protein
VGHGERGRISRRGKRGGDDMPAAFYNIKELPYSQVMVRDKGEGEGEQTLRAVTSSHKAPSHLLSDILF